MTNNLAEPRADSQGRLDADPGRERLARLIGRLIAREWLRRRIDERTPTQDDKEAVR
jgi:hypothetical protein